MTDYVPNGELFSLVEKHNCLPEKVVRIYVAEIALAIGKILVICDVKPQRFSIKI